MSCKVLIVDDQSMPRQLFESFVASSDRYELAASVDSAKVADFYCSSGRVDLIIMDIVMNDEVSGLEAAARIKKNYPEIKIIIVTSMPDSAFLKKAREIGADSFWYKEVQEAPMLEIMDRTMAGEHVFPENPPQKDLGLAKASEFTDRELDVLHLLVEGMTDREIAGELHLSIATVRYHVTNLISKTGFSSRTELAVNAVKNGLAVPGIR